MCDPHRFQASFSVERRARGSFLNQSTTHPVSSRPTQCSRICTMLISGITRQTLRRLRCSNPQASTKVHRSSKSPSLTCRWNSPSQRLPDPYLQLQPFRTYCSLKEVAYSIAKPTEDPHGNQRLTHLEGAFQSGPITRCVTVFFHLKLEKCYCLLCFCWPFRQFDTF
jgi:hypothetical protein